MLIKRYSVFGQSGANMNNNALKVNSNLLSEVSSCRYLSLMIDYPLASTPPGMPGTYPHQYFGWGGRQWEYPPNIITYFRTQQTNISRPPLKPISLRYKSQACGPWVH